MNTTYRDTIAHLIEMSPFEIEPDVQITSRAPTAEYLRSVGEEHRKRYGQFFTRPEVAEFMVRWVLKSRQRTLFDPAFGLGAFFAPVADDLSIAFAGSEKDPKILDFWTGGVGERKVEIEHEDYLLSWGKSHANIVCNPPYMRFQKFIGRDSVFKAFVDHLGLRLSGYTNTASAFLLKSLSELNGSGTAGVYHAA